MQLVFREIRMASRIPSPLSVTGPRRVSLLPAVGEGQGEPEKKGKGIGSQETFSDLAQVKPGQKQQS